MDVVGIILIMHRIVIHIGYLQSGCVSHVDEKVISAARSKGDLKKHKYKITISRTEKKKKKKDDHDYNMEY